MIARAFSEPLLAVGGLVIAAFALGVLATIAVLELEWRYHVRQSRRRGGTVDLTGVRPS